MTQQNQNATLYAGTAPYFTITVTEDGVTPTDISNTTIEWIQFDERKVVTIEKMTGGNGVTIEDGPNGVCKVALTNEDTKDFNGAQDHYLMITDSNGDSDIVMEGRITWIKKPRSK